MPPTGPIVPSGLIMPVIVDVRIDRRAGDRGEKPGGHQARGRRTIDVAARARGERRSRSDLCRASSPRQSPTPTRRRATASRCRPRTPRRRRPGPSLSVFGEADELDRRHPAGRRVGAAATSTNIASTARSPGRRQRQHGRAVVIVGAEDDGLLARLGVGLVAERAVRLDVRRARVAAVRCAATRREDQRCYKQSHPPMVAQRARGCLRACSITRAR